MVEPCGASQCASCDMTLPRRSSPQGPPLSRWVDGDKRRRRAFRRRRRLRLGLGALRRAVPGRPLAGSHERDACDWSDALRQVVDLVEALALYRILAVVLALAVVGLAAVVLGTMVVCDVCSCCPRSPTRITTGRPISDSLRAVVVKSAALVGPRRQPNLGKNGANACCVGAPGARRLRGRPAWPRASP